MLNNYSFLGLETRQTVMLVVWTIVIIASIIIESETADLVSIWFGVGSILGFVFAIFNVDVYIQVASVAIFSLVLILVTRPFLKKFTNNAEVKKNADRLVGMIAIVTKDVSPGERGEVKVNYQEWTAITDSDKSHKTGEKVLIKEIIGNKLVIDDIEEIEII